MKRTSGARIGNFLSGSGAIPLRLHLRSDLHLMRKAWHMVMGGIIALIYQFSGISAATGVIILGCALGLDLMIETARLRIPAANEAVMKFWGPFMRSCEINRISGIPYYLASTILTIAIFPKPVAILSILYLACGDPMASLFGILYGKRSIRIAGGKSLIGTLAGILTCSLVTMVFLKAQGLPDGTVLAISLVGGIAGGTAELMPFEWDDNFTIPVISGFLLWLAFIVFGV